MMWGTQTHNPMLYLCIINLSIFILLLLSSWQFVIEFFSSTLVLGRIFYISELVYVALHCCSSGVWYCRSQSCKTPTNLQTWFGGRFWPINEDCFVHSAPIPFSWESLMNRFLKTEASLILKPG